MLEQINAFLNNIISKFRKPQTYETISENLVQPDFSEVDSLKSEKYINTIHIPKSEITAIAKDEDKLLAREEFLKKEIVLEETVKQKQEVIEKSTNSLLRGVAFALASLLLIFIAYLVFTYTQKLLSSSVNVAENNFIFENALIRADDSRTLSVQSGVSREVIKNSILQTMYNEDVKLEKVTLVTPSYLRESVQNNKKVFVSEILRADDFLFTFAPSAPLALRTVASTEYALGVANATGNPEAFTLLSVNDKIAGIREMTRYEKFMYQDLKDTFKLRNFSGEAIWKDLTVNNHDLRVLSDQEGIILVYGFGNPKVIILTSNTEVFEKIFQRLK